MRRLAMPLAIALVTAACGVDQTGRDVTARNLSTGEVSTFPEDSVPPGWAACSDPACTPPASVACQDLGAEVCTLNPECRLEEHLWCTGESCACAACMPGPGCPPCDCPPPAPPVCEYTCLPKLPLLCEELTNQASCAARSDCSWGQFRCPAMACSDDKPCPPCEASCIATPPQTCDALDELACKARPDCSWGQHVCPACLGPGCECNPFCAPAVAPPPVTCQPADCGAVPEIAYVCPDGSSVGLTLCALQASGKCGWEPECPRSF